MKEKIIHYDLFAGIGGFSLALDNIFKNYERKHIFCEWEAFPTAILKKHWPDGTFYGDIADLVADTDSERSGTQGYDDNKKLSSCDKGRKGQPQHRADGYNFSVADTSSPRARMEKQNTSTQGWYTSDQSEREMVRPGDRETNAEGITAGDKSFITADTECEGRKESKYNNYSEDTKKATAGVDNRFERQDRVVILTGGFPCQPFSHAGRRKGTADDRYLWPPMLEVIRNVRPDWVIAENVRGLVTWNEGMVLETVCADLENEGYEVQPLIIPAVAVGAPHRRDRVWIIARNTNSDGCFGRDTEIYATERREPSLDHTQGRYTEVFNWKTDWREVAFATCNDREHDGLSDWLHSIIRNEELTYATSNEAVTRQKVLDLWKAIQSPEVWDSFRRCYEIREEEILYETLRQFSTESENVVQRLQEGGTSFEENMLRGLWSDWKAASSPQRRKFISQYGNEHPDVVSVLPYEASLAVAEAWDCLRFIRQALTPQSADMDGVAISAAKHRKERLKACGNAIVPAVAEKIFEAIKATL